MAANSSSNSLDVRDPRVRSLIGLFITLVGIFGLTDFMPKLLQTWANWFLFTFLFFVGLTILLLSLGSVE